MHTSSLPAFTLCSHAIPGPPPGDGTAGLIREVFARFDAAMSPAAPGQPAAAVLGSWLAFLAPDVEFFVNSASARVGRAAVARYLAPLLPVVGTARHELVAITAPDGAPSARVVRGALHVTRRVDGRAFAPLPFVDTLFLAKNQIHRYVRRYEVALHPATLEDLFASS